MNIEDFAIYTYSAPRPDTSMFNIFFAHANGIPALTYKSLLKKIAQELNVNIVTYDMRGIGKTKAKENIQTDTWGWQALLDDHIDIFQEHALKFTGKWILAGHSLGAWLALLTAEKLQIQNIWLLDPPILHPKVALKWVLANIIQRKDLSPASQKVKKRKKTYPSYEEAYKKLQKSSLMKKWKKEVIYDYLDGSFAQEKEQIKLRHNPSWEAYLFEEYPITASLGFLKLSFAFRKKARPIFFVAEKSDTCNPKSKLWVKLFLPNLRWVTIKNGSHMFPLELQDQTLKHISEILKNLEKADVKK